MRSGKRKTFTYPKKHHINVTKRNENELLLGYFPNMKINMKNEYLKNIYFGLKL